MHSSQVALRRLLEPPPTATAAQPDASPSQQLVTAATNADQVVGVAAEAVATAAATAHAPAPAAATAGTAQATAAAAATATAAAAASGAAAATFPDPSARAAAGGRTSDESGDEAAADEGDPVTAVMLLADASVAGVPSPWLGAPAVATHIAPDEPATGSEAHGPTAPVSSQDEAHTAPASQPPSTSPPTTRPTPLAAPTPAPSSQSSPAAARELIMALSDSGTTPLEGANTATDGMLSAGPGAAGAAAVAPPDFGNDDNGTTNAALGVLAVLAAAGVLGAGYLMTVSPFGLGAAQLGPSISAALKAPSEAVQVRCAGGTCSTCVGSTDSIGVHDEVQAVHVRGAGSTCAAVQLECFACMACLLMV